MPMTNIHDETSSMMIPTPIRRIEETQLNELSFIEINEWIDDSESILCETSMASHPRCILIRSGSLVRDIIALYDSFIVEYIDVLQIRIDEARIQRIHIRANASN